MPGPDKWFDTNGISIRELWKLRKFGQEYPGRSRIPGLECFVNEDTRKSVKVLDVQFRTEFFNAFNHANFDLPDNFVGSPTLGRINSAQDPRRIQFGLKFIF